MNTPNKTKKPDFMLDTVAIKLKYPEFRITNPNLFTPALIIKELIPAFEFQYGRNRFTKYQQNPTAQDNKKGIYKPRLTAYQRFEGNKPIYELHIEFSAPKLLFKNSLQELGEEDFGRTVRILKQLLFLMGVETTEDSIRRAFVVKAHFGKNIPLPYPLTAQDAISGLYKADLGKSKDINMREYRNGGQSLYFYASSYNIIFYDKLRDIATPKNKAVDKDKFKPEKMLIQKIDNDYQQEILRFEVRLTKQQSLNLFLSKLLGKEIKQITFGEVFDKSLCQKVLLKTWEEIIKTPANQLALKTENSPEEVFDELIKNISPKQRKKAHSLNTALASFGLYILIKKKGVRWTKSRIEKNWTNKSWGRLSETIKQSANNLKIIPELPTISKTQSALERFEKYDWQPK
ncbi:MAG: hypothetical protein PHQ76_01500 [Caldisericia bacterium]|nr:hypothetical protein [Caldisericia bacterium]